MKYVREREIPYGFTYRRNLRNKNNKLIENRLTEKEDNLVTARGEGWEKR